MNKTESSLTSIIVEPQAQADAAVIWLHGLGADGHDFEDIVPQLALPPALAVRFIFPHAPIRPVTINQGMEMRAWYDIYSLGDLEHEDEAGISESEEHVIALINEQRQQNIPLNRIILAGFSQGGAMALYTALRYPEKMAGLLALSTYLPVSHHFHQTPRFSDLPIFMAHGQYDLTVPMALGQHSKMHIEHLGYQVSWKEYPIAHEVSEDEIDDISAWMQSVF